MPNSYRCAAALNIIRFQFDLFNDWQGQNTWILWVDFLNVDWIGLDFWSLLNK